MSNSTPQLLRSSVRAYKLRLSNDCLTAEVNNETKTVAADSFEDSQTDFLLANMELPGEILHSQPTADTLSTSTKENTNESDSDDEFCDPDFLAQIDEAVAGTAWALLMQIWFLYILLRDHSNVFEIRTISTGFWQLSFSPSRKFASADERVEAICDCKKNMNIH